MASASVQKVQLHQRGLRTDVENHLFATDIECGDDGVRFSLNGDARRRVFVPMLGKHSASNALAASSQT